MIARAPRVDLTVDSRHMYQCDTRFVAGPDDPARVLASAWPAGRSVGRAWVGATPEARRRHGDDLTLDPCACACRGGRRGGACGGGARRSRAAARAAAACSSSRSVSLRAKEEASARCTENVGCQSFAVRAHGPTRTPSDCSVSSSASDCRAHLRVRRCTKPRRRIYGRHNHLFRLSRFGRVHVGDARRSCLEARRVRKECDACVSRSC